MMIDISNNNGEKKGEKKRTKIDKEQGKKISPEHQSGTTTQNVCNR